ncbi:unnamed protein product [Rotaria socialis]|uniref:Uncharacterized protein n=2 Tax=Rotaria socialis TaxID=392032 RepID=A0A818WMV8_9BILA|nr:unnamed protein product [Rotaria socialis]CAF3727886.1 unnamed protein product [Rotaria socialis]CAF4370928.1 unnamed protein product [Rotaria socialis]CAF4375187.1 unnamed protein product [Rotaria socialis]CAF4742293.1 unnamed protein product [Rotaria socialis]
MMVLESGSLAMVFNTKLIKKKDLKVYFHFIIAGLGSIGTFLEGPVIGWIVAQYGWSAMFTCMILLSIVGAIASFRAARYQRMIKLSSTSSSSSSLNQIIS